MPFRPSPDRPGTLVLGPRGGEEPAGEPSPLDILIEALSGKSGQGLMQALGLGIGGLTLEIDPVTGELVPKLKLDPMDTAGDGAQAARQFGLNKLTSALSGYLQGTRDVAGRRLSAFQQAASLLPGMVDPSQRHFAGFEPRGTLQTVAERAGIPFRPVEIQHQQLAPGDLARTPELDPQAASLIQQIMGA